MKRDPPLLCSMRRTWADNGSQMGSEDDDEYEDEEDLIAIIQMAAHRETSACFNTGNRWRPSACSATSLFSTLKARMDFPRGCGMKE